MNPKVRLLIGALLVAAGICVLAGFGAGCMAAGIGWGVFGPDSHIARSLVAGVKRSTHAARVTRGTSQHTLPDDGPAPAARSYGTAA
jgi:hypothetical protein